MTINLLQKNIAKQLGLDALPTSEQAVFLQEVGGVVLESALQKLVANLTAEQVEALQQFIDTEPTTEVLLEHLFMHHKSFENIFSEEILAFKAESLAVLGESV